MVWVLEETRMLSWNSWGWWRWCRPMEGVIPVMVFKCSGLEAEWNWLQHWQSSFLACLSHLLPQLCQTRTLLDGEAKAATPCGTKERVGLSKGGRKACLVDELCVCFLDCCSFFFVLAFFLLFSIYILHHLLPFPFFVCVLYSSSFNSSSSSHY